MTNDQIEITFDVVSKRLYDLENRISAIEGVLECIVEIEEQGFVKGIITQADTQKIKADVEAIKHTLTGKSVI